MARNTLKRVMTGLVLIDHETGAVFDMPPHSKVWSLVTRPTMINLLRDWGGKDSIIGQNVTFK